MTTIDAVTRIGRMMLQELLSEYDSNAAEIPFNTYVATIVTLIPSYLLCLGGYLNIWPLFGAANQLLSALVLIALAVFLRTTGRKSWMLYIPMTFMFVVTMSALCLSLYGIYGKLMAGTFVLMVDGLQLVVALALMFLCPDGCQTLRKKSLWVIRQKSNGTIKEGGCAFLYSKKTQIPRTWVFFFL